MFAPTLLKHKTTSCGHSTNALKDLTNQVFGHWKVLKYIGNRKWLCECDCINKTQKLVSGESLLNKESTSCGYCGKSQQQIDAIQSAKKFNELLESESLKHTDNLLTLAEIANLLNINLVSASRLVKKYQAEKYIKYFPTSNELNRSKGEQELVDYIKTMTLVVLLNTRSKLDNRMELDIYIPNKNLALKFNGVYWHSTEFKDKNYHKDKMLICKEQGITLIHIFEYEWLDPRKQRILKELIQTYLNYDLHIIGARNTELRVVSKIDANIFLDTYHLQGNTPCDTVLGLYYNNELVEIMTFGKPRFNKNYNTELLRLCTKAGYKVIGGASKLFKHYIKSHNTESIISYRDLSKFTGKVYEQIGMQFQENTPPNYVYVHKSTLEVLSRMQCMKYKLIEKGWGTESQTEEQIMRGQGFLKIYDCGNARYVYKSSVETKR